MGGRAAEELIFGYDKVTTGASSDITQATNMARSMVTRWGLSDKVGTIDYTPDENSSRGYVVAKEFSEETSKLIDAETKRIVDEALQKAKNILKEKHSDLEKLAKALLEFETLTGDEIKDLLAGRELSKSSNGAVKAGVSIIPNVSENSSESENKIVENKILENQQNQQENKS